MISLDITTDGFCATATPAAFSKACKQTFRGLPGVVWDRALKRYEGDAVAIERAAQTLQDARVAKLTAKRTEAASVLLPAAPTNGLRDYQIAGWGQLLERLVRSGAAWLADDMGLGKTATTIATLESACDVDGAWILVLCPAIAVPHWQAEIACWGRRALNWKVLSYGKFLRAKGLATEQPWAAVVFDEIHELANPKAQRTKKAVEFLAHNPHALRLALSGTPIKTRTRDIWQPLDLLWPGRFGKKFDFEARYCDGRFVEIPHVDRAVWQADGTSNSEELAARLELLIVRRTKAEVALELPERTRVVLPVEIPKRAAKQLSKAIAAIDWNGKLAAQGNLASLLGDVEEYKLDAAEEQAREIVANGGRPLVLTTRRSSAEELAKRLGCPCAHGVVPPDKRRAQLLAGGGAACSTIAAVTTAIDLIEFDAIIFVGLDWVPSNLLQAEARIHRLKQHRPVTIYYLIGEKTVDEIIKERVIYRLENFAELLPGGAEQAEFAAQLSGAEDNLLADLVASIAAM